MRRRKLLSVGVAAVAGAVAWPARLGVAAGGADRRLLYFTRCVGYEHEVVHREGNELSLSERLLSEWCRKLGIAVDCTKDGRVFDQDLGSYDGVAFYTSSGDLTQPNERGDPPMSAEGKRTLLRAIAAGLPFVGFHAASCSFRSRQVDPYIAMLGGQFSSHGAQQAATLRVTSPKFPGMAACNGKLTLNEEWYAMNSFDPEMHVLLTQETAGMNGEQYRCPPYPNTWAKMHGKGRVFYTAMGHRPDIWTNAVFQEIVLGGLAWALGDVECDITPNFRQVTPDAPQE
jgi:uncharacterized protein